MLSSFQNIAIVGVGLIGGSLGLALKRARVGGTIIGISRSETISTAQGLGAIDVGYTYEAMEEGIRNADLVFLCTPILRILELLDEVSKFAKKGAVITDVGSTKGKIVSAAQKAFADGVHFIGGHPMTGSEKRGVTAADPFLFENAIYVLTPADGVPSEVCDSLADLIGRLGANVVVMSPQRHDRIAAAISHLPQMIAVSLVKMVGKMNQEDNLFLRLAAGGFRDLTRIASSPYEVWRDICETNDVRIALMIDRYIAELEEIKAKITDRKLQKDFEFANLTRSAIPKDSKGFLRPHPEILVVAEDKPGVIAGISTILADEGININDIEVMKVREGEGGTLRLAFESDEVAEEAAELLRNGGYEARRR